jgi:hypothetical protein
MTAVVFSTWQFVRLMVRLEETRDQQPDRGRLYETWQSDWETLDAELERLRAKDFAAFSDLMMDHEVSFDDVGPDALATAADVVEEVAAQVANARKSDGRARRQDLDFEAEELEALGQILRRAQSAHSDK